MQKSVKFTTFPIDSQTCMAYTTSSISFESSIWNGKCYSTLVQHVAVSYNSPSLLLSSLSLNASLITWKHLIMTQLWQPTATCSLASNVMQTRWWLEGGSEGGRGRCWGLNWILCVSASYISSCQIAEIHSCALHDHRFDLCATDMDCLLSTDFTRSLYTKCWLSESLFH